MSLRIISNKAQRRVLQASCRHGLCFSLHEVIEKSCEIIWFYLYETITEPNLYSDRKQIIGYQEPGTRTKDLAFWSVSMMIGYRNRYIQKLLNHTFKFGRCYYIMFYPSKDQWKRGSACLKYLSYRSAYFHTRTIT